MKNFSDMNGDEQGNILNSLVGKMAFTNIRLPFEKQRDNILIKRIQIITKSYYLYYNCLTPNGKNYNIHIDHIELYENDFQTVDSCYGWAIAEAIEVKKK